ncbi:MAG: T9SS type A sorting domain-containing protein [bacterium]
MKTFLKIFYIVFLFASSSDVFSQIITWNRVYGGPQQESGLYGIQTFDGGYMILSFIQGANGGTYLLNLDPYGVQRWYKKVDSIGTGICIQQTKDSGFIICGSRSSRGVLVKVDRSGNLIWNKYYFPNNKYTAFRKIRIIESSNFLVCGFISFFPTKAYVLKTDSLGNVIWQNFLIYGNDADAEDITTNTDGFIYLTGGINVNNHIKALVAKFDSKGEFIWFKSYGSEGKGDSQSGSSVVSQSNRELFVSGSYSDFYSSEAHFTKFDSSGNVIFQNVLPQTYYSSSMCKASNDNYAITGGGGTTSDDILFLLVNKNGEVMSRKLFNSYDFETDGSRSIVETSDNGFLITGLTTYLHTSEGDVNIYVIKTDSLGNAPVSIKNISSELPASFKLYQNYPNPFNPFTKIRFDLIESGNIRMDIYDIRGKKISNIFNERKNKGSYELNFDGSNLSSGVYYYKLTTQNYSSTKKMLLLK